MEDVILYVAFTIFYMVWAFVNLWIAMVMTVLMIDGLIGQELERRASEEYIKEQKRKHLKVIK